MAIEIHTDYRHRCTDCGAKWWQGGHWVRSCGSPETHLCPKCPAEPKPAEPECDHECHRRAWNFHSWRYCPRCGGALTKEGT